MSNIIHDPRAGLFTPYGLCSSPHLEVGYLFVIKWRPKCRDCSNSVLDRDSHGEGEGTCPAWWSVTRDDNGSLDVKAGRRNDSGGSSVTGRETERRFRNHSQFSDSFSEAISVCNRVYGEEWLGGRHFSHQKRQK